MLSLASSTAAAAGCRHAGRPQAPAAQQLATGWPAAASAAAVGCGRRQQQAVSQHAAGSSTSSGTSSRNRRRRATAAGALGEAAAASERGGAADGLQPPSADGNLQSATFDYLAHCQQEYGREGLIDFSAGANGLPKVTLQHPAGARCELYLHGGAITSWRHSDGREMLHLREGNDFNGADPIRGGIQIAWPQYGVGALPTHGFLQNLHWSVVETAWREPEGEQQPGAEDADTIMDWRPTISLYADTDDEWVQQWPHKFEALYSVTLMQPDPKQLPAAEMMRQAALPYQPWLQKQQAAAAAADEGSAAAAARRAAAADGERQPATPSVLRCLLQVHNCDDTPFTFTTGLRTHFATQDIATHGKFIKTLGLKGKYTLDYAGNPLKPRLSVEEADHVFFSDLGTSQDRLYVDCEADGDVLFCPGSPAHFNIHNKQGFSDIGVGHPAAAAPHEARRFVCMASARAVRKVTLQPGETWVGEMVLTAHDRYWDLPAWELEDPSGVPIPQQTADLLPPRRPSALAD